MTLLLLEGSLLLRRTLTWSLLCFIVCAGLARILTARWPRFPLWRNFFPPQSRLSGAFWPPLPHPPKTALTRWSLRCLCLRRRLLSLRVSLPPRQRMFFSLLLSPVFLPPLLACWPLLLFPSRRREILSLRRRPPLTREALLFSYRRLRPFRFPKGPSSHGCGLRLHFLALTCLPRFARLQPQLADRSFERAAYRPLSRSVFYSLFLSSVYYDFSGFCFLWPGLGT